MKTLAHRFSRMIAIAALLLAAFSVIPQLLPPAHAGGCAAYAFRTYNGSFDQVSLLWNGDYTQGCYRAATQTNILSGGLNQGFNQSESIITGQNGFGYTNTGWVYGNSQTAWAPPDLACPGVVGSDPAFQAEGKIKDPFGNVIDNTLPWYYRCQH